MEILRFLIIDERWNEKINCLSAYVFFIGRKHESCSVLNWINQATSSWMVTSLKKKQLKFKSRSRQNWTSPKCCTQCEMWQHNATVVTVSDHRDFLNRCTLMCLSIKATPSWFKHVCFWMFAQSYWKSLNNNISF